MADCCICGKKIGGWGEDKLTIEPGMECCFQCAPLFRSIEDAKEAKIFFARLDELSQKMDNKKAEFEVCKYVENKFRTIAINRGYTRESELSCPVCGTNLRTEETSCPRCGAISDNKQDEMDYCKIANTYNNRSEQLDKNPLYEYRVETIVDSAILGKFDKDEVQKILREYSIKGWRLHSAFTNEIGKNAALGINATINQTIFIFERCIKSSDN